MKKNALSLLVAPAIVAATYFAFARLGLVLAFPNTNISPVWPPSGVALAAVLLIGAPVWPGILAGAFVAILHAFLSLEQLAGSSAAFAALAIAIGHTLSSSIASTTSSTSRESLSLPAP